MALKLIETLSTFRRKVGRACADDMNTTTISMIPNIDIAIRTLLYDRLWSTPEIQSLIAGNNRLSNVLGVDNAESRCRVIVGTAVNSLRIWLVPFRSTGYGIRGSLTIVAIPSDYADLLSLSESTIADMTKTPYNWLEYLLVYGRLPITTNYIVLSDRIIPKNILNQYSRTGEAIMKESSGKNTRVPEPYAGTYGDNLISRAIDTIDTEIYSIISRYL